jgi:hypothetical protein
MSAKRLIDTRAENKWHRARDSYAYASSRIKAKRRGRQYTLDHIDLILVSNFKGGFASIAEPEIDLDNKLKTYSDHLSKIGDKFEGKKLHDLNKAQLGSLCDQAAQFLQLTLLRQTAIDGFGPSRASALLNIYFPDLLPILDRRALNGVNITGVRKNKQGQVKNIERHYQVLIGYIHARLRDDKTKTIEGIDREMFSTPLGPLKKRKGSPQRT